LSPLGAVLNPESLPALAPAKKDAPQ
jgi:hypothetical protein